MTQKIRKAPEGAQSPCYELGNGWYARFNGSKLNIFNDEIGEQILLSEKSIETLKRILGVK
jgi:hypothetical protein